MKLSFLIVMSTDSKSQCSINESVDAIEAINLINPIMSLFLFFVGGDGNRTYKLGSSYILTLK